MLTFLVWLLLAQIPNLPSQNGTVTGILRTAAGKPAPNVRISAVVPPAAAADQFNAIAMASIAETDAEGRYRLEGIPAGRYYIAAGRLDFPTYYPGSTTLSQGTLVLVTPAATIANIDFVLRDESDGRSPTLFTFGRISGFSVPVTVVVEGGGKIPVFQNGSYPFIRATNVLTKSVIEASLGAPELILPLPPGSTADEYRVTVNDLQGYSIKNLTSGSTDLQKGTLKAQPIGNGPSTLPQGRQQSLQGLGLVGTSSVSGAPLMVVLTKTPTALSAAGVRVSGRSVAAGDEIYISGNPGTLYSDGTFEFQAVPAGLHRIVKLQGNTVTAGAVLVGNSDVDGLTLRNTPILPSDLFQDPPKPANGTIAESKAVTMVAIAGRVLDETSHEPIDEGTVTIAGYGAARRFFAIVAGRGFSIPDLLPGTYSITINVPSYRSTTQVVIVGAEELTLDLIAQKEGN